MWCVMRNGSSLLLKRNVAKISAPDRPPVHLLAVNALIGIVLHLDGKVSEAQLKDRSKFVLRLLVDSRLIGSVPMLLLFVRVVPVKKIGSLVVFAISVCFSKRTTKVV
jgi:hypothetical protein